MYQVFDNPFLAAGTWRSGHANDEERFFQALDQVVRDPAFSADELGNYIEHKVGVPRTGKDRDPSVRHYVDAAWAVRGYLRATGVI